MEILKTILSNHSETAIIITAAGSSTRMGGNCKKEFLPLKTGTVLSSCVKAFLNASQNNFTITDFIITIPENCLESARNAVFCDKEIPSFWQDKITFASGGNSRQKSVFNGLKAIKNNHKESENTIVLIHDGARPFIDEQTILRVYKAAREFGAAVPGITPTDTQKEIDENGFIIRHLVRKNLSAVQTPQGFDFNKLFLSHQFCEKLIEENNMKNPQTKLEFTDDTEIYEKKFDKVKVVEGNINNIKITYPSDLEKLK